MNAKTINYLRMFAIIYFTHLFLIAVSYQLYLYRLNIICNAVLLQHLNIIIIAKPTYGINPQQNRF